MLAKSKNTSTREQDFIKSKGFCPAKDRGLDLFFSPFVVETKTCSEYFPCGWPGGQTIGQFVVGQRSEQFYSRST